MKIIIINGPNLNLLGKREPEVYGSITFTDYFNELKLKYPSIDLEYFQSNIEGELIDKIQETGFTYENHNKRSKLKPLRQTRTRGLWQHNFCRFLSRIKT